MTAQFQFVMRSGPTPGKIFPLEEPGIMIGRDNTSDLVINDAEISRKHARLIWQDGNYVIEDVGSTNGTFINGKRLSAPFVLYGGEIVTLGENIVLIYEPTSDPNATMLSVAAQNVKKSETVTVNNPEPEISDTPQPTPIKLDQQAEAPVAGQLPKTKSSNRKLITIIVIVLVLVFLCICLFIAYFIYNAPASFWCKVLPFLFNPQNYNCTP